MTYYTKMENKEVSDGIKVPSKFIYELLLDKNHMKVVWTVVNLS